MELIRVVRAILSTSDAWMRSNNIRTKMKNRILEKKKNRKLRVNVWINRLSGLSESLLNLTIVPCVSSKGDAISSFFFYRFFSQEHSQRLPIQHIEGATSTLPMPSLTLFKHECRNDLHTWTQKNRIYYSLTEQSDHSVPKMTHLWFSIKARSP